MMEHNDHMALGDDKVSVRHLVCCMTLFKGLLILLVLFNVAVSHGSALVFRTTLGADRGANAAADAGNRFIGIMIDVSGGVGKSGSV
jgi:hypothetical protein